MAITRVAKGANATTTWSSPSGTTASLTPPLPAGLQAGDVLVLFVSVGVTGSGNANYTLTWPSAFAAPVIYAGTAGSYHPKMWAGTRQWQAGDTAPTINITNTGAVTNAAAIAFIVAYRGVDVATLTAGGGFSQVGTWADVSGINAVLNTPSVTTTVANSLAIDFAAIAYASSTTLSTDASYTQLNSAGTGSILQVTAEKFIATPGATGTSSHNNGQSAANSVGAHLILKPITLQTFTATLAVAGTAGMTVSGFKNIPDTLLVAAASGKLIDGVVQTSSGLVVAAAAAKLINNPTLEYPRTLAAAGVGALSINPSTQAALAAAGLGAFTVAGLDTLSAVLAITGQGSLIDGGLPTVLGALNVAAVSSATIAAVRERLSSLALAGSSSLTLSGLDTIAPSWAAGGVSSLAVAGGLSLTPSWSAVSASGLALGSIREQYAVLVSQAISAAAIGTLMTYPRTLIVGATGQLIPNTGWTATLVVGATPALVIPTQQFGWLRTLAVRATPALTILPVLILDYHPGRRVIAVVLDGRALGVVKDATTVAAILSQRGNVVITRGWF